MPDFRNKEEYEQWKAQRLKEAQEKKQAASNATSPTPEEPSEPKEASGATKTEESKEGGKEEGPKDSSQESPKSQKAPRTKAELTDIGGLFRNSWEIYKRRIGVLIALYFFSLFTFLAVIGIFGGIGLLLSLILSSAKGPIIAIMVVAGITAGMVAVCWGLAAVVVAVADEGLGFKEALGYGWQRTTAFIWFFSIAGFIITGGFLLFIIPGVIFLVWFAFGQFILANKNERGMNAMLKSKAYVKGHWFEVFIRLFVVWIVSAFIGIIPFIGPFLAIAFMPFMMIFVNLIYEDLKTIKGDIEYSSSSGEKFKWIGAGCLGYIVLPVIIIIVLGAALSVPLLLLKDILSSPDKGLSISSVSSGLFSQEDAEVKKAYQDYRQAFMAGDITTLKGLLAAEKARELENEMAPAMLAMAKAFSPKQVNITSVKVQGDSATIAASGENGMNGTIQMRKENGAWKVSNESWNMSMDMTDSSVQQPPTPAAPQESLPPNVVRATNYPELLGVWAGNERNRAGEWRFNFSAGYNVHVQGPSGEWYRGKAAIHYDLGTEAKGIHVPPGATPLDIDITEASNQAYIGKTALSAYSISFGKEMKLCGSEPGVFKRPTSFDDTKNFRCLTLVKSSEAPRQASEPTSPPATSGHTGRNKGPDATGEAIIIKNGLQETYPLMTGFFSETRFKDPKKASVQFQFPGPEHSNSRRIELVLDTTKTGRHFVDGKATGQVFFSDSNALPYGESTPNGYVALLRYVADGGQIFPPKESCIINITSPYTGGPNSFFSGEISNCTVHSAGIDYQLSSIKFTVRGAATR